MPSDLAKELKKSARPDYAPGLVSTGLLAEMIVRPGSTAFVVLDRASRRVNTRESVASPSLPMPVKPFPLGHPLISIARWPLELAPYESERALIDEIQAFIRVWVDLEPRCLVIISLYIMFTYCFDEFEEVPYLRVLADLGSGKSRLMLVLSMIAYRAMYTVGVSSPSSLFRAIHMIGGTLILDEMDLREKTDKTSDIVQMLNAGYMKDSPVFRCDSGAGKGFSPESFRVFGPKIISSREHLKDHALESRCIPIMMKETKRRDIPLTTDGVLRSQGLILRNKLMQWRFDTFGTHVETMDKRFSVLKIASRTRQLLLLLSAVVRDEETKQMLFEFGAEMHRSASEMRSESAEGEMCAALVEYARMHAYKKDEEMSVGFKEIAHAVNEMRAGYDKDVTSRYVSYVCREVFHLRVTRTRTGKTAIFNATILNALIERFGGDPLPEVNAPVTADDLRAQFNMPLPPV